MTEKRFTISIDSNDRKSLWDDERTEEEPLIALNRFGEIWGIDDCCKLLNSLNDEVQLARTVIQMKRDQITSLLRVNREGVKKVQSLAKENEQLKKELQKIQDNFEVSWTQNYIEFDKDKLYIKDNNTEIRLDGTNLFIEVYIPQTDEYYRFNYIVAGRSSKMREFINNYNSGGDDE